MKSLLLLVFLSLHSLVHSQLIFEEVAGPVDFNIASIRKSPIGEYFIQAYNDISSIYSSLDGQVWTKSILPVSHTLGDIQFFNDGTPLLQTEGTDHLIRRDGIWYTMDATGFSAVRASFIKEDTLFIYQDRTFAYSLDKGQTFTTAFILGANIIDHSAHLWKFDQYFVLHYTTGASDYLSVFNELGVRVLDEALDVSLSTFTYNTCGEVLINDYEKYYLLKEQGLSFETGVTTSIIPGYDFNSNLFSQGGNYYNRTGNTIYQTTGCDFTWSAVVSNDLIKNKENIWFNHQGDVFLYDNKSDYFIEQANGSNVWEEHKPDIDYAFVKTVDESVPDRHAALTTNAMFHKNSNDADWIEIDSSSDIQKIQYSPSGDMYVSRANDILYSKDNGNSFTSIALPDSEFPVNVFNLEVLGDNILFIIGGFLGDCYYTLNNGQTWSTAPLSSFAATPLVKLVDNYILVAELNYQYQVFKINLGTNATSSVNLGDFISLNYGGSAILDDGTIYFQAMDTNNGLEGLYRFRFGEGLKFVGQFPELEYLNFLIASGNDLFGFGSGEYYLFNGTSLTTFSYTGLPSSFFPNYILSDNGYVYVIVDNHKIFRSNKPLLFPQYITGTVYHESNLDCVEDTADATLQYWQVKAESDNYLKITTTNNEGKFTLSVPKGDYTLSSQPITTNWDLCTSSFPVTIDDSTANVNQDFLAIGLADCADLEIDFSTPLLHRCFDNYYSIRVRNTGPQASEGTTLTLLLDPFFEFPSANIPFTLVGDSIMKFDLGILEVNEEISFQLFFTLSCDATLGMEHCLTGILSDDHLCGVARSSYTECQANIGSYDPNDKRVFNEAGKETTIVDKGEYIYYHISFQNTGTDTAFKVRVIDHLSPKLDLGTLEMLSASQPYTFEINDGPALVVTFDNILLPNSSTNEPASHGFFKFRVKPLPEYDYGNSIPNQAGIYFDFNNPVYTNVAVLTIQHPVGTTEIQDLIDFNIYPNPANSLLYLTMSATDRSRIGSYEIMDFLGQTISQSKFPNGNFLNVAHLPPGVYTLLLKDRKAIIGTQKFVRI